MEPTLAKFFKIMSEGRAIYEELVRLSRDKKLAIADRSVDSLDALVRAEQGVVMRLSQWEKSRAECVARLAAQYSAPEGAPFTWFAQKAPPEERSVFTKLHSELGALLKELSALNDDNKRMLESRLDYVRFAIDTLSDSNLSVYDSRGGEQEGHESSRTIFNREV